MCFLGLLDDQPSDEIKIGGFARLFILFWNDEVAAGLKTGSETLLEGSGDGIYGGRKKATALLSAAFLMPS